MARTADSSLATHQRLAWAYLDRMAAGDYVKASVVLSVIARIYPATYREVAGLVTPGREGAYPATLSPSWGGATSSFIAIVLDSFFLAVGDRARGELAADLDSVPAANVGAAAGPILSGARGTIADFVAPIANADMGALPGVLDSIVARSLDPSATTTAQSTGSFTLNPAVMQRLLPPDMLRQAVLQQPPTAEGGGITTLPEQRITARAASPGMPSWGWWVLGALALGAVGYGVYTVTR